MLKHLLLSGWFRVQPFLKYVLVVVLIAPLVGASGHSSSAYLSQETKVTAEIPELDSVLVEVPIASEYKLSQPETVKTLTPENKSESRKLAAVVEPTIKQQTYVVESLAVETVTEEEVTSFNNSSNNSVINEDPFKDVELAPPVSNPQPIEGKISARKIKLVQRLKAAKSQSSKKDILVAKLAGSKSLKANKVIALRRNLIPEPTDAPVSEEPDQSE